MNLAKKIYMKRFVRSHWRDESAWNKS